MDTNDLDEHAPLARILHPWYLVLSTYFNQCNSVPRVSRPSFYCFNRGGPKHVLRQARVPFSKLIPTRYFCSDLQQRIARYKIQWTSSVRRLLAKNKHFRCFIDKRFHVAGTFYPLTICTLAVPCEGTSSRLNLLDS